MDKGTPDLSVDEPNGRSNTYRFWQPLIHLAVRHRRAFVIMSLLTLLSTGADLLEPLIYRMAINDVTGLFVHHTIVKERGVSVPLAETTQKHSRGHIAPRTAEQTFSTLLWAVFLSS